MAIDRIAIKLEKIGKLHYCAICLIDQVARPLTGTELHEIIPRSYTVGNEAARDLSFQEELTVILCHEHHQHNHQVKERSEDLLRYNQKVYGRERVQAAYDRLQRSMRTRLMIRLPSDD